MLKQFSTIMELKSIRDLKSKLSEREKELSTPLLSDISLISAIYGWFKEIVSEEALQPNIESVTQRKKFLFVILLLFAPSTLAGGRLPIGIRDELTKLFPGLSPYAISHNISDIAFLYRHYKNFRQDIELIYDGIIRRLGVEPDSGR